MERAAIFIFDWQWNYIAHKFLTVDADVLKKASPLTRDMYARNEGRALIPAEIKDVHTAIIITDAKDDEITPEVIEEVKLARFIAVPGHAAANQSHVETWEYPEHQRIVVHKEGVDQ